VRNSKIEEFFLVYGRRKKYLNFSSGSGYIPAHIPKNNHLSSVQIERNFYKVLLPPKRL
jgi:hypothetical protein